MRLLEQRLGVSWTDITEWLRSQNGLAEIEDKLASGQLDDVVTELSEAAAKFAADVHHGYVTSGQKAAAWLDGKVTDSLIRFDQTNTRAVTAARDYEYKLIRNLTEESRQTIRAAVVDGHQVGANPRVVARRIRDSIGLAAPQEQALANYRAALESGDWSKAMGYELRDGRGDRSMRAGMDLSPARIDSLVERYRTNSIAHRAETIARTESLRATHAGTAELYRQAIERGDIDADQLQKEWHAGPATRYARADHRALDRHGAISFGEDFILPDGIRMAHPGDERGGAGNVANCRCAMSVTIRASA